MTWAGLKQRVRYRDEDGVALLVVLMFILLLTAIVVEFVYETQVQASLIGNRRDEFQAYVAAKSAVAQGLGLLETDLVLPAATGNGSNNSSTNANIQQLIQQYGNKTGGTGTNTTQQNNTQQGPPSDSMQDQWAQGIPMTPINDATMQCSITDESGKLNLNALLPDGKTENPVLVNALRALFTSLGVEDDPTDAILDWLDTDSDTRGAGAESDEYQSLDSPYSCKNAPMDSIEELLLIKGVTPDLYFNCNRTESGNSAIVDPIRPDQTNVSLADLLTVHGDPKGTVNVNTARPEVLEALITSVNGGNASPVEALMQARVSSPFETIADFHNRVSCPVIPLMSATNTLVSGATTDSSSSKTSSNNNSSSQNSSGSSSNPKLNQKAASQQPQPQPQSKPQTNKPSTNNSGKLGGVAGASGEMLTVSSDAFCVCGDGVCNGAMVRIEAYVYRTPTEARSSQIGINGTSGTGSHFGSSGSSNSSGSSGSSSTRNTPLSHALEAFRILDWRVIR